MRHRTIWLSVCAIIAIAALTQFAPAEESAGQPASKAEQSTSSDACVEKSSPTAEPQPVKPAAIAPFLNKGIAWLIAAQHPDGGWGGGSHSHQDVRDPQQVPTDPATTSFTLLSLLRAVKHQSTANTKNKSAAASNISSPLSKNRRPKARASPISPARSPKPSSANLSTPLSPPNIWPALRPAGKVRLALRSHQRCASINASANSKPPNRKTAAGGRGAVRRPSSNLR